MDSTVDPSADVIWESVAIVVTAAGTEEMAPHTDEEWKIVRRAAIRVIEATNLLQMPGRLVAHPGDKSENPNIELAPEDICWSARLLRDYGNLSSPFVLFVLHQALQERAPGGLWWMAAFGAGFSSHGALLEVT